MIEDPDLVRLIERLMSQGTALGEFAKGRICRGVVTGLNEAFVIDQGKRDELIEKDPKSAELIKPWLRGRDIRRWRVEPSGEYIIFTPRGIDIGRYPAIQDHLRWFQPDLEKRATAHLHPWYELQQPKGDIYSEFSRPKIVWPDIARHSRFAIDATGSYLGTTCFFLPAETRWMLPILNSGLIEFLLCHTTSTLRGGFLPMKRKYMAALPIVTPGGEALAELEGAMSEIGSCQDSEEMRHIEAQIDSIVFDIYGVSPMERKLLLDWLGERRESLGEEMPREWRKLNTLRAVAGAWRDTVDWEQLKRDIRVSREIRTRPVPRL